MENPSTYQLEDGTGVQIQLSSDERRVFTLVSPSGEKDSFTYSPDDTVGNNPPTARVRISDYPNRIEAVMKWKKSMGRGYDGACNYIVQITIHSIARVSISSSDLNVSSILYR